MMVSPKKSNEFLSRPFRLLIIGGSVLLLVFCVWSAAEARKKTSNRIVDWLPKGTEELDVFQKRYHQHFAEGEYLMVSWKGCTIDDQRLDILAAQLTTPLDDGSPPYFAQPRTTRSVIDDLLDVIPQLTEEGAKNRLAGWLIGRDGKTACLVLVPNPDGWQNPADGIAFLFTTLERITGLPRSDIYVAGTSIDSVAISTISKRSQETLLPFFLLFSLFLLFCCLRHYFAALLVFWVAMINEELAGTLLYWCGAHVDSVSMLNSSLVYVLTISGSVHLINYYRRTLAEMQPGDDEREIPMKTFHRAIRPCSLATFTTILGMGSLAVSKMVPIQTFGLYASLALFLGTLWFFLCILSVFQERPIQQWFPDDRRSEKSGEVGCNHNLPVAALVEHCTSPPGGQQPTFWSRFGPIIFYWRYPITVLTFLLLVIFAFGIKDLHTSVTFHGLLPKKAKVLQDYQTLEEQIGGLIPIEVVVHFPAEDWKDERMLDQLHFLTSVVVELRQTENVDAVVSVLNFLPSLPPRVGGGRAVTLRAAFEGELKRNQDRLRDLRFFDIVEGNDADVGYYWRISLRVASQKKLNYATMIADVQERLDKVKGASDYAAAKIRFDVTGGVPLVFRAQEMLLWDLIYSFITAFGFITVTIMIVLRGIMRGLLAMVPNVLPCVLVFGMLGLCAMPVDMGSMMTASVALGISVDNTLHLLTWMSIALRRGLVRKEAVFYALRHCGTALSQTMIICGVGMLVFGWSDFVPVARFALLLCTILIISFVGAIVVLPAILFCPLGHFFEVSGKDTDKKWIL